MSDQAAVRCKRCLQVISHGRSTCVVCGYPDSPPSFTMIYESYFEFRARKAFSMDIGRLAGMGYRPLPGSVGWDQSPRGYRGRIGIQAVIPTVGSLNVIYGRRDLTPERAVADPSVSDNWG
jgi:hypothetical protein